MPRKHLTLTSAPYYFETTWSTGRYEHGCESAVGAGVRPGTDPGADGSVFVIVQATLHSQEHVVQWLREPDGAYPLPKRRTRILPRYYLHTPIVGA